MRLNSELAKKPPEYLEYLVVHDVAASDRTQPRQAHRDELNRMPVRHEDWTN